MAKFLPMGTTFSINSKQVGGLITVGLPQQQRGTAETTDSASNFDRSFLPGIRDAGTVQLTMRYDPDDVGQLELQRNYSLNGSGAVVSCVITLPSTATPNSGGETWTFTAFVTEPPRGDMALTDDKVVEVTATLKLSGTIVIAP